MQLTSLINLQCIIELSLKTVILKGGSINIAILFTESVCPNSAEGKVVIFHLIYLELQLWNIEMQTRTCCRRELGFDQAYDREPLFRR